MLNTVPRCYRRPSKSKPKPKKDLPPRPENNLTREERGELVKGVTDLIWSKVRQIIGGFDPPFQHYIGEELFAAGQAAAFNCSRFYDPAVAAFTSYSVPAIVRAIRKELTAMMEPLRDGNIRIDALTYDYRLRGYEANSREDVATGKEAPDPYAADPAAILNRWEEGDWQVVLSKLNPRQAEAVSLRFRDGLTLEQIGKRMGVSGERARQTIESALDVLRERMPESHCIA